MKNFLTLLFLLNFITSSPAQDLIERTQQNKASKITINNEDNPNRLAKLVAQNRKSAKTSIAVDIFKFNKYKSAKITQQVSKSVELEIDETTVGRLLSEKQTFLNLKVPVNESNYFELELVRNDFQAPSYKVSTSKPTTEPYQQVDMLFYKGIIKNDNRSLASVTIANNQIRILASDTEGNYTISKMPNSNVKYVLYNDVNLKKTPEYNCGTPEENDSDNVNANTAGNTVVNGECIPIYIEADFAFFQNNGSSVANVEVYLNGLFNEVETIYFNESIGVTISEIFVHTAVGPFAASTNTAEALNIFQDLRQNNFNGRVGHLVSGRALGGGRAAGIDVLCSVNSNFAVSALNSSFAIFPIYSWDLYVFTHELGHVFGSRHTHACVWNGNNTAIDGCATRTEGSCAIPGIPTNGGTIMSYCHQNPININFSLGFGPQPGDLLRDRFNNSPCILECEASCNNSENPCNFIPNPNFDDGLNNWTWWNCDVSTSSGICKIENISAGQNLWDAQVYSNNLCLVQNVTYRISFDAYSETSREFWVKVGLGEAPWTSYLYEPVFTTTNFRNYSYQFNHSNPSTSIGIFEFHISGTGNLANIYIDNVVLQPVECSSNEICEKISNGNFQNGFDTWDYYGMQPGISSGECFISNFDPVSGDPAPWSAALIYFNVPLEQNQTHTIQFSARSVNAPKTIIIKSGLGEAPWTDYLWETANLTTQMQTFSYTFTMQDPSISNGTLEFQVGETNTPLYIDNVSFVENDCESANLSSSSACLENINLFGMPDKYVYEASVSIISSAEIEDNISYFAGERISLKTGFKVGNGAVFKGAIQGCED